VHPGLPEAAGLDSSDRRPKQVLYDVAPARAAHEKSGVESVMCWQVPLAKSEKPVDTAASARDAPAHRAGDRQPEEMA